MIESILCVISCSLILLITWRYMSQIRWVKFRLAASNDEVISPNQIPFSILICVRGEAPYLLKYLSKILHQAYSSFEIILVHHEIPSSLQVKLEAQSVQFPLFRLLPLDQSMPYHQKKQALNYGIMNAKYDWIITTDDDCYPASDQWLIAMNKLIQTRKADIVLGLSPFVSQSSILNKWIRFDWLHGAWNMVYLTMRHSAFMGVGRHMAFRKNLWTNDYLNRYEAYGHGDDTSLVQFYPEKNVQILLEPKVYTIPKLSWKEWFIQKNRHISSGKMIRQSQLIHLAFTPVLTILFWLTYWLWVSFFEIRLYTFVILIIYLMIKILSLFLIEKTMGTKKSSWYYVPFFDFGHTMYILIAPLLTIFIPKRWK